MKDIYKLDYERLVKLILDTDLKFYVYFNPSENIEDYKTEYEKLFAEIKRAINNEKMPIWSEKIKTYFPEKDVEPWLTALKLSLERPYLTYPGIAESFALLDLYSNGKQDYVKEYLKQACSTRMDLTKALSDYTMLFYCNYSSELIPVIKEGLLLNKNNPAMGIEGYFSAIGVKHNNLDPVEVAITPKQPGETED